MGNALVWLAFGATVFSVWHYYQVIRIDDHFQGKRKDKAGLRQKQLKLARSGFYAMTALVTVTSAYLLYLIFTHQFQYDYIYRYSSRDLSVGLLLSTFWAGQAGSFLLWAWFIAVMGIVFMRKAKAFEAYSMFFLAIIQGFFLVILTKVSPFMLQAHTPPDGAGLNPLLQNFWMVIHPPILFLGYAAVSFPLVLGFAAMLRKDYDGWVAQALPWSLFTSITLGAGIILGGYWAYGTLGWGGYWGWDPVENASLVPWLVNFALFHGLIVERTRGALRRTNFLLALASFVLVLYATFLTRSGVLADFSVHSFPDLGINALLIIFMVLPLLFGLGLFVKRFRDVPVQEIEMTKLNRENALAACVFVLLGSALLTLVGTSFPLISRIFTQPSNVNISFYNQVNLPFGIGMTLLLGVTPFLKWGKLRHELTTRLLISLVLSGLTAAFVLYKGLDKPLLVLFIATAGFAFWSNLIVFVQQLRVSWLMTGAPLAHIGVALFFVGVIVSGNFDKEQYVQLTQGQPAKVLGKQLVYEGAISMPGGKDVLKIRVSDGTSEYMATPRLYFTEYNNDMMKEPYVESSLLEDFYISPLERRVSKPHLHGNTLRLRKGEQKKYGNYQIRFAGFDMSQHGEDGSIKIAANLEITEGAQNFKLMPALSMKANNRTASPVKFPGKNGHAPSVKLTAINAGDKSVLLAFSGIANLDLDVQPPKEQIALQVSTKPFMNVLWLGTVLLTLGAIVALKRSSMMA